MISSLKNLTAFAIFVCGLSLVNKILIERTIEAKDFHNLSLELKAEKNEYLYSEPIEFDFKISNPNDSATRLITNGPMFGQNNSFYIRHNGGQEVIYKGVNFFPGLFVPIITNLTARQSLTERRLLYYSMAKKFFDKPGNYEVRIEMNYEEIADNTSQVAKVLSPPMTFTIKAPTGRNKASLEYIENVLDPLHRNSELYKQMPPLAVNFAKNFSDTVYWKYEVYRLAEGLFIGKYYTEAEVCFYEISDQNFIGRSDVNDKLREISRIQKKFTFRSKRDSNMPINMPTRLSPPLLPVPGAVPPPNPPVLIIVPFPNAPKPEETPKP